MPGTHSTTAASEGDGRRVCSDRGGSDTPGRRAKASPRRIRTWRSGRPRITSRWGHVGRMVDDRRRVRAAVVGRSRP